MPVTLASRAEIVKKMDQQFNDDLKMRQDTTTVGKEMLIIASLIPKGFKSEDLFSIDSCRQYK